MNFQGSSEAVQHRVFERLARLWSETANRVLCFLSYLGLPTHKKANGSSS